ncbi:MAG TPA: DUF4386 domain-containing protein [Glaciibacter sp.]|nr:DUF4386 domain-containing protein [Glaciibacter sp.]
MDTVILTPSASATSRAAAGPGSPGWSQRTSALIAGSALALMAVLSGFAVFGAIAPLITPGDAEKTATAILGSETLFRSGIAILIVVVLLDVVVAIALFRVFERVNHGISTMAAGFRLVYSAVFLIAILQLATAVTLLDDPEAALRAIESFYTIWYLGLILFGVHLLLEGYLAYRSGFMAKIFGILLVIAGLGYVADGFGIMLVPNFTSTFSAFTFVGEVALFLWLLIKGRALPAHT